MKQLAFQEGGGGGCLTQGVGELVTCVVPLCKTTPPPPTARTPPPHPNCKIFVDVQCISEAIRDYILADAGHMPACSVAMFAIQVQLQR